MKVEDGAWTSIAFFESVPFRSVKLPLPIRPARAPASPKKKLSEASSNFLSPRGNVWNPGYVVIIDLMLHSTRLKSLDEISAEKFN